MTPDRWRRIMELLEAAILLDREAREAFLVRACEGDASLLAAARIMLRAYDTAETLPIEPSSTPDARTVPSELEPPERAPTEIRRAYRPIREGDRVGPYAIEGYLGSGTFGVVHRASRRQDVRLTVALKTIKPGMDSRRLLARFQLDRQALALLNHPNVARFYDAGTTSEGQPYFALEYVKGLPLTAHCDVNRLGIPERLELFLAVCDGVQHAHQQGIIHRDLKPGNILVAYEDGKPVPKIIDFGLASALNWPLSAVALDAVGSPIGTPAYMSPEQAEISPQGVDSRSDIYSLGVLLYELLIGATPFQLRGLSLDEQLRIIREQDPPDPTSKLRTLSESDGADEIARNRQVDLHELARHVAVDGDLHCITMTCVDRNRTHRYDSASELAADVRRFLNGEPISRRPRTLRYVGGKLLRRYRKEFVAGAVGAAVLLAAVVLGSLYLAQKGENDRARAADLVQRAQLLAYRQPAEADRTLDRAERLDPRSLDARIVRAYLAVLRDRPDRARTLARSILAERPHAAEAHALLYGLLVGERPVEAAEHRKQAEALINRDRRHYLALGLDSARRDEAIALLDESLEAYPWSFDALWQRAVRLFEADRHDEALEDADTLVKVGSDLDLTWLLRGAILLQLARVEANEESPPDEARARRPALRSRAIDDFTRALELSPQDAHARYNRGMAHFERGDLDEALVDFDAAVRADPGAADAHTWRGKTLLRIRRYEEAESALDTALGLGAGFDTQGLRAEARFQLGRYEEAAADVTAVLPALEQRARAAPERRLPRDRRRDLLELRGQSNAFLGRFDDAERDFRGATEIDPGFARGYYSWGQMLWLADRYAQALPMFERAADLQPDDLLLAAGLGVAQWVAGDEAAAATQFERLCPYEGLEPVCLWLWEIRTRQGDGPGSRDALEVAGMTEDPMILALVGLLRGERTISDVGDVARVERKPLDACYYPGAKALVEGNRDDARKLFERCLAIGRFAFLEHHIAQWRLRRLEG